MGTRTSHDPSYESAERSLGSSTPGKTHRHRGASHAKYRGEARGRILANRNQGNRQNRGSGVLSLYQEGFSLSTHVNVGSQHSQHRDGIDFSRPLIIVHPATTEPFCNPIPVPLIYILHIIFNLPFLPSLEALLCTPHFLSRSFIMSKTFTQGDVASHNNPKDLYIIVDEDVYDLTKFQDEHPGMCF
jgi:Cytochrome b5-like Heme/Steroid binding domain